MAIDQILQSSIKKIDVISMFRCIYLRFGIKGVSVRNANCSQFIANQVKRFLASSEAKQEFTHIATSLINDYIRALQSIVITEMIECSGFLSNYETKRTFSKHFKWYIEEKKLGQIGHITPM